MPRIVVTGMGVISSLGIGKEKFKAGLLEGECGIRGIEGLPNLEDYPIKIGAQVKAFDTCSQSKYENYDITSSMALATADEALSESKLLDYVDKYDIGISVATSLGGINAREQYYREIAEGKEPNYDLLKLVPTSCIAGNIAQHIGSHGPLSTVVTACSAGGNAIGIGVDMIKQNNAKAVIVVGVDPFSSISFSGFTVLQALSNSYTRPFNEDRDGLSLGEGSACLILEEYESAKSRGAKIYAEVLGYGISNDAYHPTSPDPKAGGAIRSMQAALEDAKMSVEGINYINAHGTGTVYNDQMELLGLEIVFGETLKDKYISSNKSQLGHTLGTAGVIEAVASLICLEEQFVPATINFENTIDKKYNFVPNKPVKTEINTVLSNSFAFGGNTASVIFGRV